jgi:hypothetical protein
MLRIDASFGSVRKYPLVGVLNSSKRAAIRKSKPAFKVSSDVLERSIVPRFVGERINRSLQERR